MLIIHLNIVVSRFEHIFNMFVSIFYLMLIYFNMLKSNKFTKLTSTVLYKRICLLAILSLLMTPLSFGQSVSQKLKENTVQNQIILKLKSNGVPEFPAAYSEVISVGATDCDNTRVDATNTEWESSYGEHIDLVALGGWIVGLRHDTNEYGYWIGGTSMAAPMVAGAASLLLSINPNLSIEKLRDILRNTAEHQVGNPAEDTPEFDMYYGAGRMNVEAALASTVNCDIGAPCDDNDDCTIGEFYYENCDCNGGYVLDNNNNGVCDLDEGCIVGVLCDDNDDCTIDESYDENCDCNGGYILDNNNDGICDLDESCDTGAPCDDNDDCTIGEFYYENCECNGGTLLDDNNDGICDLDESCDIGASCDDNDDCTDFDSLDVDCNCVGTYTDSDDDGICDADDACPFDETNNCGGTPDYCDAYGSNSNYEYINRVIFGDIDNTSGDDGGYGNYTEQVATVGLGDIVPIGLAPGFSGNSYNEAWAIWIDFNQDGYHDYEEQIYSNTSMSSLSGYVYIPTSATPGETRMRVAMKWSTSADPCETFTYGEVEDYLVNITDTPQNYSPVNLRNENNLIAASSVRIFPNPATDFININLQSVRDNGSIKIVTLSGKTVMEQDIDAQTTDLNIAVGNLSAGVYLIRLNLGGGTYLTERFVKLSN